MSEFLSEGKALDAVVAPDDWQLAMTKIGGFFVGGTHKERQSAVVELIAKKD
jgi:hypothetical protein